MSSAYVTPPQHRRKGSPLSALIARLHFYIGLFVGPFLMVAALSGITYALTPQLENWLYHDALTATAQGEPQPLSRQIATAQRALADPLAPVAVRPAPHPGGTTRIMFSDSSLDQYEHRALFIDPVSLAIQGDLTVYGTSGSLALRTWIDQFHRGLLLGNVGRLYSELAASWLWIVALGGVVLWFQRYRRSRAGHAGKQRLRQWHSRLGLCVLIGLLFFSATGLTWSQWAGSNIATLRHAWGWGTPGVSTDIQASPSSVADAHAGHHAADDGAGESFHVALVDFDRAYTAARQDGIDAGAIEMIPPTAPARAWKIREIDRSWPTQVDQLALDPHSMAVTDRADFATFPLAAKLTRWGIDLHMGNLLGLPNQLALVAFATGLVTMVCWGYAMWWQRRPRFANNGQGQTLSALFVRLSWRNRFATLAVAIILGVALPVMGASLVVFVAIDALRWRYARRRRVAMVSS